MSPLSLAIIIIGIALVFDYINGFHDAANSIATIVATRVLTPFQAVVWASFFNFAAAFVFGEEVAKSVAEGFIDLSVATQYVMMAALIGAIVWDLITWWLSLPTSSSHALIGGMAGAAMAHTGLTRGLGHSLEALNFSASGKWGFTLKMIVGAPLIGMMGAYVLMIIVYWLFRNSSPSRMDKYFRRLQLLSAGAFSLTHGGNDAQKTAGIITGVLFTGKLIPELKVPYWVLMASYSAIGLGTLSGGWRIVHTMGGRLTRLKPRSGFCAETGAALSVWIASHLGVPVSTTHAIAGAIAGVGSIQRMKAVRWGIATSIVWAWVITIPAAAAIAWVSYWLLHFVIGS
jgi:PiT family inorganic phosphate transporter